MQDTDTCDQVGKTIPADKIPDLDKKAKCCVKMLGGNATKQSAGGKLDGGCLFRFRMLALSWWRPRTAAA